MAMEAFNFSVAMVNADKNFMPHIRLGSISLDTCEAEKLARMKVSSSLSLKFEIFTSHCEPLKALRLIWPNNETYMLGVIGPMFSSIAMEVANFLGLFKKPQAGKLIVICQH